VTVKDSDDFAEHAAAAGRQLVRREGPWDSVILENKGLGVSQNTITWQIFASVCGTLLFCGKKNRAGFTLPGQLFCF